MFAFIPHCVTQPRRRATPLKCVSRHHALSVSTWCMAANIPPSANENPVNPDPMQEPEQAQRNFQGSSAQPNPSTETLTDQTLLGGTGNNDGDGNSSPFEQGGNNGGGDDGDGDDDGDDSESTPAVVVAPLENESSQSGIRPVVTSFAQAVWKSIQSILSFLQTTAQVGIREIPAPVLTAFVTAISTISGVRIKASYDIRNKEKDRQEAAIQRKVAMEGELRRNYEQLASPVLQAAAKLADRLHMLVDMRWDSTESSKEGDIVSPLYSAYLVARYFTTVEILKSERPLLDYGFPAADRILYNILGRIQGLFCANDHMLREMQNSELYFRSAPEYRPLRGGLLEMSPRRQALLGEMLLRRVWTHKYNFLDVSLGTERIGGRAILSFREFSRLFDTDENVRKSFQLLVDDLYELEQFSRANSRQHRRCDRIGARVFFVQSALLDLVDFFDPLPDTRAVPMFRRRRVQINLEGDGAIQRKPMSLTLLYRELALVRDHKGLGGDPFKRLGLPYDVEVYVTGRNSTFGEEQTFSETGECPISHRILMVLNEMSIPHKTITITPDRKPSWYYLLHPDNRTPLLYHRGQVVDEPSHIITYLKHNFPDRKSLASAQHLDLRLNTKGLTKFHPHFVRWLSGEHDGKDQVELELRALDRLLKVVKKKNKGQPFFGGTSFSSEDTAMVPYLHHIDIAGRAIKQWRIPPECKYINNYLSAARRVPSFMKTAPTNESVIEGYGELVKKTNWALPWRLADML